MNKPIIALLYDFDHTLAIDDMQNFSLIPSLGIEITNFWAEVDKLSQGENVDKVLSYMYTMVRIAKEKGIKITKEYLNDLGKDLHFFDGVTTWFKRINAFGEERGIKIEHYLLSSGTKEIVDGCSIAKEFNNIFGCEFLYDIDGNAIWPKQAINYTTKTQFLFRISKGALDLYDDVILNQRTSSKRVPFTNMVYLGDGLTDVPCMVLVKEKGGKSIAIYQKGNKEKVLPLFEDGRVNFICKADYRQGSQLEKIVKLIIEQIGITEELLKKEVELGKNN